MTTMKGSFVLYRILGGGETKKNHTKNPLKINLNLTRIENRLSVRQTTCAKRNTFEFKRQLFSSASIRM